MESVKKNLSKSIVYLTKFLNNTIPLFHDQIINYIKFDFGRNQSIPQIKSHYEQNKIYINNFLNYVQSCSLITIIGHEILVILEGNKSITKNKDIILKQIKLLLDSIKSLYNPLDIFNKYQLLGKTKNSTIKSMTDIINFIKNNENIITNNSKSISYIEDNNTEGGLAPIVAVGVKAATALGTVLPFMPSNKKDDYDYDYDYDTYGNNEYSIIEGKNEKFLAGNSCTNQHKIHIIKLESIVENNDNTDRFKNVILIPFYTKLNKLQEPTILLDKMKINKSLKYTNKQLKDTFTNLNKYINEHSKRYIKSNNKIYIDTDFTLKSSIKNACVLKIGKCEDLLNDIMECIDNLNTLDNTIIFLNICDKFKILNNIKKVHNLNKYIKIIKDNIDDLQTHENIYMRKITKQNILKGCQVVLIKNKELKHNIKQFIEKNNLKCTNCDISNTKQLLEFISDQLKQHEQLLPQLQLIENDFVQISQHIIKICDSINYFIKPGQTVTCIKHPMKIIDTIFYIDIINAINDKKFNDKVITDELSKLKKQYPAYFKSIYTKNLTKSKIDKIIDVYL